MGRWCKVDRNILKDETIGVTGRRSEHDDYGNDPVLKKAGEGCVEGFVAGPESREGEYALATKLLNHCNDY